VVDQHHGPVYEEGSFGSVIEYWDRHRTSASGSEGALSSGLLYMVIETRSLGMAFMGDGERVASGKVCVKSRRTSQIIFTSFNG
jgi:hypothetical protein